MYYVYMIRCDDNSLYTGIAIDICKRIKEHYYKTKECAKYTRNKRIISLEALWITENRSKASKLEYYIKHLSKKQKETLVLSPSLLDVEWGKTMPCITLEMCLENTTL